MMMQVFLITDGALQEDRARIARLVRESQARRQMLVAILVDENITKQSIVEFNGSSVRFGSSEFCESYVPGMVQACDIDVVSRRMFFGKRRIDML